MNEIIDEILNLVVSELSQLLKAIAMAPSIFFLTSAIAVLGPTWLLPPQNKLQVLVNLQKVRCSKKIKKEFNFAIRPM